MGANGEALPTGKLPPELLERLLTRYARPDPQLIVGPGLGVDAAVIAFGDRCLVAKTDPITFATDAIGWYAVNVNANDVAVMGARPRWFLATVLLPEGEATAAMAEAIFEQIDRSCSQLSIALAGGHTEITYDLPRPLVIGVMLGEAPCDRVVTAAGARPGDAIALVKPPPIEGTALIAREKRDELLARGYERSWLDRVAGFLYDPGISVVAPALLAREAVEVHAMHDPTEGGIVTGLWELAQAANVGLEVFREAIPILPEGQRLCATFGLDPLGTIASGSLLIALSEADVPALRAALGPQGFPVAIVGRALEAEAGLWLVEEGERRPLPRFPADEITKLF